ncbi:MAG: Uma2 family endonuclease [Gammaproteobacteria bacterium]
MSALLQKTAPRALPATPEPPSLESGDRLARAEFERRYQAQPNIRKAELIEGVVYVASPVRVERHGEPHSHAITWLGLYVAHTPDVRMADNATLRLDLDNEPQPDAVLWIDEKHGGKARIGEDDYLEGAPELMVEVAASSAAYDLHDKLRAYRRNGVQEYLVLLVHEREARWHSLQDGEYRLLPANERGITRSLILSGLWFHAALFWNHDLAGLLAVLQEGLNSPEHQQFALP